MPEIHRCRWVNLTNPAYVRYHDLEWGRPHYDDAYLFELLLLESFQAGLSWECILNKREAFRRAFDGFDPQKIAAYDAEKCAALMQDAGIVRNRLKIAAAVNNAKIFLSIQAEWGSFSEYLWHFTGGNVLRDAFGVVAMVAMTPLITIQGLGLIYRLRTKHGAVAPAPAVSGDAFALDDLAIIDL